MQHIYETNETQHPDKTLATYNMKTLTATKD
jgi:hypothetical protein